ncbi:hypothetical protein ANN_21550, partial [Periplaneta americana]
HPRNVFTLRATSSLQNGYPARRRSLVDDARFETLVVKQTKQCVLEEARQRSNGKPLLRSVHSILEASNYDAPEEVEQRMPGAEDEVVSDAAQEVQAEQVSAAESQQEQASAAEVEGATDHESEPTSAPHDEPENHDETTDADLTEEEMILANSASESKEAEQAIQKAALVLKMREGIGSLARILKTIENFKGTVTHLETRASKQTGAQFDVLVRVDMSRQNLLLLIRSLRQSASLAGVTLLADNSVSIKDPWFPRHASDLDNCNHLMTKYEPELDMNHPGFADKTYRERRKKIAEIAFSYKYGDSIPRIEYTPEETSTWTAVFNMVLDLMPKHACAEYRRVFKMLQDDGIFRPDRIPQLEEMSAFMKKHTGFTLRPAAGLLTARDFLASLAFRVFQSTQYVRHTSSPYHTPEP